METDPRDTRLHRHAELVLNHLGYILDYADVRRPLPQQTALGGHAAIVSWFSRPLPKTVRRPYLEWARVMMTAGKRLIVLGETGGDPWGDDLKPVNLVLSGIGLLHSARGVNLTSGTKVTTKADGYIGFERQLDPVPPAYAIYRTTSADAFIILQVRSPAREGGLLSTLAVAGPAGGFIAPGYALLREPQTGLVRWLIDPFRFFRRAVGARAEQVPVPVPVPDVTTVSGRRIFVSHVDGYGLHDVAKARGETVGTLYGTLFHDEIVRAFPDLPLTLGIIGGDVDMKAAGRDVVRALVSRVFAYPHVEIGVHTYSHPFRWPAPTLQIPGARPGKSSQRPEAETPLKRIHDQRPFSIAVEVDEAKHAVEALAPAGKHARLFQWSGDSRPSPQFVAAASRAGLANLNGGDGRYDFDYPSIAYLSPLGIKTGDSVQVYAIASGGSSTTTYWRPAKEAIAMLGQTIATTETPRLKGFSLHYALAAMGNPQQRERLKAYLSEARAAPLAPLTASRYAAMVNGFYTAHLTRTADDTGWTIRDRGALQTVRFDTDPPFAVDLAASRGVLGSRRHGGALYVALDSSVSDPVIVPAASGVGQRATRASVPGLVESRWVVSGLTRLPCQLRFTAEGFGKGEFVWGGMSPRSYDIIASRGGTTVWQTSTRADSAGQLRIAIEAQAIEPVAVTIRCTTSSDEGSAQ